MTRITNTIEAITAFYERFADDMTSLPRDFTEEEMAILRSINGHNSPDINCGNLASMLKILWVAHQSKEMEDEDLGNALWGLHEFASMISVAISVQEFTAHLLNQAKGGCRAETD
ncbi:MAG: hypothetical protein AXA67_02175 [Methylothermaceae bacteria B42]|nr:MAG: hypothetical protein AXA67_02175 [Methylothermaceae bacteria B42]HHJ40069.1 hypothetical protein [Methylothermaceae bacterium]